MSELTAFLIWTGLQVTLLMLPAALLHWFASRRDPVSGARVAIVSLGLVLALTVGAFLPRISLPPPRPKLLVETSSERGPKKQVMPQGRSASDGDMGSDRAGLTLEMIRTLFGRLGSRVAPSATEYPRLSGAIALGLLGGTLVNLARLLLSLRAVNECRRRSALIHDSRVMEMLSSLRAEMGCRAGVELREIGGVSTAATGGWLRPFILFPMEWRTWDKDELRAVMAHELAHIVRGDYGVGLASRVVQSLHFYHPLVRWMVARLQLQQELACDALGARFAGGREIYLRALARLALRQDARASNWPVRAFLPARRNLIRRIKMLQVHETNGNRGRSLVWQIGASAMLAAIAVGVWLLPRPVRGALEDRPTFVEKAAQPGAEKSAPAFELSYVPDNAQGFLAFRPAAIFHRPGMDPAAAQVRLMITQIIGEIFPKAIASAKAPPNFDAIEQVTMGFHFRHAVNKKGVEIRSFNTSGVMIRTVAPFDWSSLIHSCWPEMEEVHEEGKTFFRLKDWTGLLGKNGCFCFPDDRTLVFDEEETLLQTLHRGTPYTPEYARGDDWKRVERSLAALLLDNKDGRTTHAMRLKKDGPEDNEFARFFLHTERWLFALADSDEFDLQAFVTCRDSARAEESARVVKALLAGAPRIARGPEMPKDKVIDEMLGFYRELVEGIKVEHDGSSVLLKSSARIKLADFLPLFLQTGL